jgi:Ser/Thr protein kinase RdoA (MazF antagonist)
MNDKATYLKQAQAFLAQMGRDTAHVSWLAQTHHPVMHVDDDRQYTLHLYPLDTINSEALQAQHRIQRNVNQGGLCAPQPVQSVTGESQIAALYTYVEGEGRSVESLTAADVQQIGGYLARLHRMSLSMKSRPRFDVEGLFGEEGVYALDTDTAACFTAGQQGVMQEVIRRVDEAMQTLSQHDDEFGLIHADLLLQNVLFRDATETAGTTADTPDEQALCALDWEYCGAGYYLYDLTPLLWQLKPRPACRAFQTALWQGYTAIRPLESYHADVLETFIAARQVASLRWVAQNRQLPAYQERFSGIIATRIAELKHFLQTGTLQRHR